MQPKAVLTRAVIIATFIALANVFAFVYVTHERYIFFWDYSVYWDKYRDLGALLCADPGAGFQRLAQSIRHQDYSDLAILPIAPLACVFGPSRMAYMLAMVNLLLVPTALLGGLLAARLAPDAPRRGVVFVGATALFLLLHPVWLPLLEGRPDIIGVGILFALMLTYTARPLAEQRPPALLWMGALLALAFLTRRWYAYWAVAFFVSAPVAELLRQQGRDWLTHLRRTLVALIVIGASAAAVVLLFAAPRVTAIIGQDYSAAYSAYKSSPEIAAQVWAALQYFGRPLSIAALLGLLVLALRPAGLYASVFFGLQAPLCFLLFWQVQDFNPHHYYLLLPSLFVGVGALLLLPLARGPSALRIAVTSAAAVYLLAAMGSVFVPQVKTQLPPAIQAWMPATTSYPKVRSDFDQMEQLLAALDGYYETDPGQIYVNASSMLLNYSQLQNFCSERRPPSLDCNAIIVVGDVDSRDGFPCALLRSKYVVTTSPPHYHMQSVNQSVIGLPASDFEQGRGIASSFRPLEPTLRLEDGARILLFKKESPLRSDAVHELERGLQAVHPEQAPIFSAKRCTSADVERP